MNISNDILNFGSLFSGRLNADLLQGAMDYVNYNECLLALDTLLDHLYEYDVSISFEEYSIAMSLVEKFDLATEEWNYLKELIND